MLAATLLTSLLAAAAAPAGDALTFDEALGLAERAPAVHAAQRDLASRISSQTSNPELLVEPGYRVSPSATSTTHLEGVVSLSQSWSLAGLSSRRRESARAEGDLLAAEARATALARRLSAAQAWIDLWAAQAALADARQEAEIAADLAARTERAAEHALLTRAEAADAVTYRGEARLLALSVEGETTDLGYRLARETARPPVALATAGPLPDPPLPPVEQWPRLIERAGALPDAVARRLAAHADAAHAAEARAARGTQLMLGASMQRDNLAEYVAFGQIGLTFPFFDRGEREAAPYAAAAARERGQAEDAARAAATELARALHEVQHTQEVLAELDKGFLPASAEAARLREVAFRVGDATVLEVLLARRSATAARARLNRARAAHAWARVKVWLELSELARAGGES
jgi:cobalt-zinc-cadmium efflux system outer membrane protein